MNMDVEGFRRQSEYNRRVYERLNPCKPPGARRAVVERPLAMHGPRALPVEWGESELLCYWTVESS